MDAQAVQLVRSLNRTVAARVGVLGDRFLGRGQPMGALRTLWEIGLSTVMSREVVQIRSRSSDDTLSALQLEQCLHYLLLCGAVTRLGGGRFRA